MMQTACRVIAFSFLLIFSFHPTQLNALTITKSFSDNDGIIDNDGIVLKDNILTIALNVLSDNDSNIIGCWRLDESSGNTASDSTNSHDGICQNMEDENWIEGVFGNALSFDADNESVLIPDDNSLDGFSAFTLECWVNLQSSNESDFIYKDNDSGSSYLIYLDNEGILKGQVYTGSANAVSYDNDSFELSKWHHIALTLDNESVALYIDGSVVDNTGSLSGTVVNSIADLNFGNLINGKLDEVFLRNVALSSQTISDHAKIYKPSGYIIGKILEDPDNEALSFNTVTVEASDITATQKAYVFFSNDGQVFYDNEGNTTSAGIELSDGSTEISLSLSGFIGDDFYYKIEFENNEQGYSTDRPNISSLTLDYSYNSIFYVDNNGSDVSGDGSQSSPWQTISHAVSQISGSENFPKEIKVQSGTYLENVVLTDYISITGGYNDNWNRPFDNETGMPVNFSIIDADNSGRCIKSASYLTIDGFILRNANLYNGSAINIDHEGDITISNCEIKDNKSSWLAAGISVHNGNNPVTIQNCKIYNNTTDSGSAISIHNNTAKITIKDSEIYNNTASGYGGGIYIQCSQDTVLVDSCSIHNNTAEFRGGGIYQTDDNDGKLIIKDSFIEYNEAGDFGGGICSFWSPFEIKSTLISSNSASLSAGGIYVNDYTTGTEIKISDSEISYNKVEADNDNYAQYIHGGGFYLTGGAIGGYIKNSIIKGNKVIYNSSQTGVDLLGGAGLRLNGCQIEISDSIIESNSCETSNAWTQCWGGGIYASGNHHNLLKNCILRNNSLNSPYKSYGAGISAYVLYMLGCVVNSNSASGLSDAMGGAIDIRAPDNESYITNCTIYGNTCSFVSNGIYNRGSEFVEITNSILWNNGDELSGNFNLSYSCIEDYDNGSDLIYDNPMITHDNDSNVHLTMLSPCINKGDNDAQGLENFLTDIDNESRINFSDSAARCDIGADEYYIYDYYVSDNTGNDSTGNGTKTNPWQTISHAIEKLSDNDSNTSNLHVQAGTYNENIVLKEDTNLYGGYDSSWQRDILQNETIIDADNSGKVIVAKNNTLIDGFTLTGGNSSKGSAVNIENLRGWVSVFNCNIKENISSWLAAGIGIHVVYGLITIDNCIINNNESVLQGGSGLSINSAYGPIYVSNSKMNDNYTESVGAGVFIGLCTQEIEFDNCDINGNTVDDTGAGLYIYSSDKISLSNCNIQNNTANGSFAGALLSYANEIDISACNIYNNTASSVAGGLYLNNTDIAISDSFIDANKVNNTDAGISYGGGIYLTNNCTGTISGSIVKDNQVTSAQATDLVGGGGMRLNGSAIEIRDTVFDHNFCFSDCNGAIVYGGGIYLSGNQDTTIKNCVFKNNYVDSGNFGRGGAISASRLKLLGSILYSNDVTGGTTATGGGLDLQSLNYEKIITNCTIYGNTSSPSGNGGVINRATTDAVISNCILWNNDDDLDGNVQLSYSCVKDNDTGTLIWDDPVFENECEGDFHLKVNSPCIDEGDNDASSLSYLLYDIDGEDRIINQTCDIGADEFFDNDGDDLSDYAENNIYYTDARQTDSDGDGISDSIEASTAYYNPIKPNGETIYTDTTTEYDNTDVLITCYKINDNYLSLKGTSINTRPVKLDAGIVAGEYPDKIFINTKSKFSYLIEKENANISGNVLTVQVLNADNGVTFSFSVTCRILSFQDDDFKIISPQNNTTISIKKESE